MTVRAADMADLLGLDTGAVGAANLERTARERMRQLGLGPFADYLRLLRADPEERRLASGLSVVGETWLFRDPGAFAHLGGQAAAAVRPVRVLSAPCATGEEAYSAALALMAAGLSPADFLIDAFDANPASLAAAARGRFGPSSFRNLPGTYASRFDDLGDGTRQVRREAASRVRFRQADLLADGFRLGLGPYQAVLCRNFAMYLDPRGRKRLAATLAALMAPGAVLYVGHAEVTMFAGLGFVPLGLAGAFACWAPDTRPRQAPPAWSLPGAVNLAPRPKRLADLNHPLPPGPGRTPPEKTATPRPRRGCGPAGEAASPRPAPAQPADKAAKERAVRALADAGRLEEALDLARDALNQGPPTAELYHLTAVALLGLGRRDQAESALRRAVYLSPGHVEALTLLELLAAAKGDDTQAALLARRADRAADKPREAKP